MCLDIGILIKTINFPFGTNEKSIVLCVPIFKIGTPKTINFPFGANEKLMVLGVPALKQFRVCLSRELIFRERLLFSKCPSN